MRAEGRRDGRHEGGRRRGANPYRRLPWIGAGVLAVVVGITFLAADGAPPSRMTGAGMVPAPLPPPPPGNPAPAAAPPRLSGEVAMEEARLAALREARLGLEREIETLRAELEAVQRALPSQKTMPTEPAGPAPAQLTRLAPAAPPAPVAPAAVPAPPPPADAGLRIVLHHRSSSSQGAAAAEEVAGRLREAGLEVQSTRQAPFVPSTPVVRYFHEEDQAAAARIAGRLGRGWAIQDFRAYQPQPSPQTIEVWIPGG
ncbi:hypothetical protein G3576_20395 [Roseomonas stagni]|uniref:LytR/CpsA/Psr regulator C-terminal domain-containing protein n=1 Tax=Falsiroseomonas algicola TaxID=2716930 RepID=A0A6M1LQZ3_9PROT|nr:hypothetical protein [Falsiroseomonas algicola]NGM22389.1 hypothetical protein [Falsiroseomonas algicola]